jgi:hypothetical protein
MANDLDDEDARPPDRWKPDPSVLLSIIWGAIPLITPYIIFASTKGRNRGGEIGLGIGVAAVILLMVVSFWLGSYLDVAKQRRAGVSGCFLLFLGLALGLGVFFIACSAQLGRALGH